MFDNMLRTARQWLENRSPEDIARRANIEFDSEKSVFCMEMLGETVEISYPDYHIHPEKDGWHSLLMLHYLHLADGTPVSGEYVSFSQLHDGMVRGGGFDSKFEDAIARRITDADAARIAAKCASIGGKRVESNADYEAEIKFFPNYPLRFRLWLADDEFPSSGKLKPDASADHYLTIEDAVTAGEILLEILTSNE